MRKILWLLAALTIAPWVTAYAQGIPQVRDGDHVLGDPKAPITIVEFGSLTCPHCADFDMHTLPDVRKDWIDTGKAKLVFRPYPLNGPDVFAIMVTQCVPADRFFNFVDGLYKSQPSWVVQDFKPQLRKIAQFGGMSADQFDACLANDQLKQKVISDGFEASKDFGVNSTPTFFVNGTKLTGFQDYETMKKALAAAEPKP